MISDLYDESWPHLALESILVGFDAFMREAAAFVPDLAAERPVRLVDEHEAEAEIWGLLGAM